ncbi:endonuclease domain-containing protein [Patescibacteria group bacterium]|nr:MAG: endonuclease domain-containing protein [Patescibacteria group bacterium]
MPSITNRQEFNERRRDLRHASTKAEQELWRHLQNRQVGGLKFRRQFGIGPYIVDFYCSSLKLVVEVDGDSHFTPEGVAHDEERTAYLADLGFRVVRFMNDEVLDATEEVLSRLHITCQLPPPWKGGA